MTDPTTGVRPRPVATPDLAAQRRFWDWHWEHWRERRVINAWTLRRWDEILAVVQALGLRDARIIDLGCGRGWFSAQLARFGTVTGIDLSERGIAAARAEFPQITFIAGSIYDYPLPRGYFDLAVSQEVVAHVEDQGAYVERAAEVLKPGGYLILTTGNKFVMERMAGWPVQPPAHIARQLGMRELKRLLRRRFRVLRARTFIPVGDLGVLRWVNSPRVARVLGALGPRQWLERAKERAGFGYQMLVLAQRAR
jgi:2-polyprenyl-3-methyl-5-hydroxy-6-metoxy-1,4-benzoquinol methylase